MFSLPHHHLFVKEARWLILGSLERFIPRTFEGELRVGYADPRTWSLWRDALCISLVTGIPYYLLFFLFGKIAVLPSLILLLVIAQHHGLWALGGFAICCAIGFPSVRRQRQYRKRAGYGRRSFVRPIQSTLTFVVGCENWNEHEKWRVSGIYSLFLQMVLGLFPPFTALSAILTGRLFMVYYERVLVRTGSCEAAAGYVSSLRLARTVTAAAVALVMSALQVL